MRRCLALLLSFALVLTTVQQPVRANPALLLLGGEGLGLLSGLAIKQGLRFAGSQAARVFFQSAAKRSPEILTTVAAATATGVAVDGAMKYTVSADDANTLMGLLSGYAGQIINGTLTDVYYDSYGNPVLDYYSPYTGSETYYGSSTWYTTLRNVYYSEGIGWQTGGVNIHYLDARDGLWKSESMSTSNSLAGTHIYQTTQVDALNTKLVITYEQPSGAVRSVERYFPFSSIVNVGDPVVLRSPFPTDSVALGEPRAIPIPLTGTFDVYIPFPLDQAHDILEGNPTFVDVGPGVVPIDPPINPPLPGPVTPPWVVPGQARIDFSPLQIAGERLTNKFPFSIPWDVQRQLSVFDVAPQTPKFDVSIEVPLFSTSFDMEFRVDFSMFDGLAVIIRWFLILAFDIGLILSLRRFFPE